MLSISVLCTTQKKVASGRLGEAGWSPQCCLFEPQAGSKDKTTSDKSASSGSCELQRRGGTVPFTLYPAAAGSQGPYAVTVDSGFGLTVPRGLGCFA